MIGQYRVLRTIVTAATGRYQLRNPCDGVNEDSIPTAIPRDDNFLTAGELREVLAFVRTNRPTWYPAVILDAFTGLRWGELSGLRWDDIDEAAGLIRVSRGNWKGQVVEGLKSDRARSRRVKPKHVPLLPAIAEVLRDHRRRMVATQHPGLAQGWVFPTARGTLHKGSPLRRVLAEACAAVDTGRRVTPHGLRHTANDLLRRHAPAEVTRAIVGHATERMTHHYSHVDDGEKIAAVERVFDLVHGSERGEKGVATGVEGAKRRG